MFYAVLACVTAFQLGRVSARLSEKKEDQEGGNLPGQK
jgi:hypothetical protein